MFSQIIFLSAITICFANRIGKGITAFSNASELRDFVKSNSFVDKTHSIEYFYTEISIFSVSHVKLLAPEGSGKTTNLNMLKLFLEARLDEKGKPLPPNSTEFHSIFAELKVGQNERFFAEHFGKYPVIYMDFAEFDVGNTKEKFGASFKRVLLDVLQKHKYLLQSNNLDELEKIDYQSFLDWDDYIDKNVWGKLSQLVSKHFQKTVIVLIDNIYAPCSLQVLKSHPLARQNAFQLVPFLRPLLRDNLCVHGSISTGPPLNTDQGGFKDQQLDLCPEVHFNYLDSSKDPEVNEFYGFSEEEVRFLLSKNGIPEQEMDSLRKKYGVVTSWRKTVFHTRSIVEFCALWKNRELPKNGKVNVSANAE